MLKNNYHLNSLEAMRDMLKERSIDLHTDDLPLMHSHMRKSVSLTKLVAVIRNRTVLKEAGVNAKVMKNAYPNINRFLRAMDKTYLKSNQWKRIQFETYGRKRKEIRLLRRKWTVWTSQPRDIDAYEVFACSCEKYDMNSLFSTFNAPMNLRGSGFPTTQFAALYQDRFFLTQLARQIKTDMFEANLLLAACDEVLNKSDQTTIEHLDSAVTVYKQFANGLIEIDKYLVTRARDDITRYTANITSAENRNFFPSGFPAAEVLREQLKQKYYWLEFTTLIVEVKAQNISAFPSFTEYHTDSPVIVLKIMMERPLGVLLTRHPNIVLKMVNSVMPWNCMVTSIVTFGSYDTLNVQSRYSDEFAVYIISFTFSTSANSTISNGRIPVVSYLAVVHYGQNHRGTGPARSLGRAEEVKLLSEISENPTENPSYGVIAVVPCDSEVYNY